MYMCIYIYIYTYTHTYEHVAAGPRASPGRPPVPPATMLFNDSMYSDSITVYMIVHTKAAYIIVYNIVNASK